MIEQFNSKETSDSSNQVLNLGAELSKPGFNKELPAKGGLSSSLGLPSLELIALTPDATNKIQNAAAIANELKLTPQVRSEVVNAAGSNANDKREAAAIFTTASKEYKASVNPGTNAIEFGKK